jgi:hypothetical protein
LLGRHAAGNLGLPRTDQDEGGGSREGVHEHQEVGERWRGGREGRETGAAAAREGVRVKGRGRGQPDAGCAPRQDGKLLLLVSVPGPTPCFFS